MRGRWIAAFGMAVIAVLLLAATVWGRGEKKEAIRYSAEFMDLFDTVTQITGYAESEEAFKSLVQSLHDDLEAYHRLYDIYHNYEGINNLKSINDNAGIGPVKVEEKVMSLLLLGKEMYRETGGRVNIAYGSVLSIWHEYRSQGLENPEDAKLPPMDVLKEASRHTDLDKLILDQENGTAYLTDPFMSLDVGALGKGYAVELVCEDAKKNGIEHMLVSVGGNIKAIGGKADGQEWKAGIQNPEGDSDNPYLCKVGLVNRTLVTSGNYQRYYVVDGKNYHHIINPKTLMPAEYFTAVSILSDDSGMADGLSTALYNMTYEEGSALVESLDGVEAMWVWEENEIKFSSGFEEFIRE